MILSQHVYQALIQFGSHRPGNILEIGAFEGAGTRMLAQHFPDRRIYTIDPFIEDGHTQQASQCESGQRMLGQREAFVRNTQGLTNVHLFECTTHEFGRLGLDLEKMNIGTVIIDGSHHYQDVLLDTEIAQQCLANRTGVIIFDDLAIEDVRRAIQDFIPRNLDRIQRCIDIENVALYMEIDNVNKTRPLVEEKRKN